MKNYSIEYFIYFVCPYVDSSFTELFIIIVFVLSMMGLREESKLGNADEESEVVCSFKQYYFEEHDEMYVAAIKSLADVLGDSSAESSFELLMNLKDAKDILMRFTQNKNVENEIISQEHSKRMTVFTIVSSCDIFHQFVLKNYVHSGMHFKNLQNILTQSAREFPLKIQNSLKIISNSSRIMFVQEETTILTHSNSECVKHVLINASKEKKIYVYFTSPENIPKECEEKEHKFASQFIEDLKKEHISVEKINLKKAEQIFFSIDFVISGAELVIDNGGIIGKKGIKVLSQLCMNHVKPFYVVCEAFKFLKIDKVKYVEDFYNYCTRRTFGEHNQLYEYIPQEMITLFYTDIGIFTPSIISYELSKIYKNDFFQF